MPSMDSLPCRNHADRAAETLCARCADLVCGLCAIRLEGQDYCPGCAPRIRGDLVRFGPYVPWEDRKRLGLFQAWWRTVRASFTQPREFCDRMPLEGGLADPLLFGMVMRGMSVIFWGFFVAFLYVIVGIITGQTQFYANAAVQLGSMVWNIPIAGAFLFVIAGIIHLGVVLVANGGKGFEATFRVFCYGRACDVLDLVPGIGPLIAVFYRVWLYFMAYQRAHAIGPGKSLFVSTLPVQVWAFLTLLLTGLVIVIVLLLA